MEEEKVLNLPLATQFVHVKGGVFRKALSVEEETPKVIRSWEIIHLRLNLRRIRMVQCGIGDDVVALICC